MNHLSLVELNKLIQNTLKNNLETSYWVVAEIGQLNVNQKGHCYLELIENQENQVVSRIKATIWSYTYRNLSTWFQGITGQPLAEGLKIMANVKINYHELYGLSLNIQDIDASYTIGEKERQRQEIINLLVKDGVMDMNKEQSLPLVPQNIAIISSPTAAGYGDFVGHLNENPSGYLIKTTLFKAMMQGAEAGASIVNALHKVHDSPDIDLVVIIRGGGSQLDLECFDNYDLCSNIAQFPLPIITGIGHEKDDTIADMVAHTKLKTPTAVAEFIVQGIASFEIAINELVLKINKMASFMLQNAAIKLQQCAANIRLKSQSIVLGENHKLKSMKEHFVHRIGRQLEYQKNTIGSIEALHLHLSPENTFRRGYSLARIENNPVTDKNALNGRTLSTYSLTHFIESKILSVKKNGKI